MEVYLESLNSNRKSWTHQEEAMKIFLTKKNGILEMATGTGKTYTAIQIMKKLLEDDKIKRIIVITYGNDLLQQWYHELLIGFCNVKIFRFFDRYKEWSKFILEDDKSILILSREANRIAECLMMLEKHDGSESAQQGTLLLFDEVHGFGASSFAKNLKGSIQKYTYRLGLSATPERDYDETGNDFIKTEIGDIIYHFGLEDAIEKGILCSFSYLPIYYSLTDEERDKKRKVIAAYEVKRKRGIPFNENDLYRDLAKVNKTACQKIPLFEELIIKRPDLLDHCIMFVENREYGLELQKMLVNHMCRYHTYYSEDTKNNLNKFSKGQIDCLITCKKISEGIDIKLAKNIILFSSDKGQIVTVQRIGRSLRKNPEEPDKEACVVDFIYNGSSNEDITTDKKRMEWLNSLAKVREKNEIIQGI